MTKFSKKTQAMIDNYYDDNKDVLQEAGYTKDIFEANLKVLMKENSVRAKKAIKIFEHKTDFTDKTIIGAENLVKGIKNMDKQAYHDLRKDVIGWKEKVNYSKFDFVNDKYRYTNKKNETYEFTLITGPYGSQYWEWSKI